jgi:hypothetical protein
VNSPDVAAVLAVACPDAGPVLDGPQALSVAEVAKAGCSTLSAGLSVYD